jgi:hypothetical protein
MKLRIFKADKGDCVLLTGQDGKHVLIDGGMRDSYTEHVSEFLSRLGTLERVYVSHIDRDHVFGILQMMDDRVAWKVHRFQRRRGNPGHPLPRAAQPPRVKGIWQNALHEQAGDNRGEIQDLLGAEALMLSAHPLASFQRLATEMGELAQSVGDQLRLSRRVGPDQLDIPVNPEFGGGLMYHVDPPDPLSVGRMRFTVIGPFDEDLKALRREWNEWLREKPRELERIRRGARRDERRLIGNEIDALMSPLVAKALASGENSRIAAAEADLGLAKTLGRRQKVTVPNLASLMFHVEENGKTVLLTGDGHCDDILLGLERAGLLDEDQGLHVNVLKVPHHGSENNTSPDFCRRITANHYVFCGNGAHENPDVDVVRAYIDSRIGPRSRLSPNAEARQRFKLWFNYHPDNEQTGRGGSKHRKHLRKIESLVRGRAQRSSRLRFEFIRGDHRVLNV